MIGGATMSTCGTYRYHLWRMPCAPDGAGRCTFLMLNPSTATDTKDDPTIRRCIRFARDWGYEYLDVLNIFALRSTDPEGIIGVADSIGPENDRWLMQAKWASQIIVAAWGEYGAIGGRGEAVRRMLAPSGKLHYLHLNKSGHPKHPLYIAASTKPTLWSE